MPITLIILPFLSSSTATASSEARASEYWMKNGLGPSRHCLLQCWGLERAGKGEQAPSPANGCMYETGGWCCGSRLCSRRFPIGFDTPTTMPCREVPVRGRSQCSVHPSAGNETVTVTGSAASPFCNPKPHQSQSAKLCAAARIVADLKFTP